jgi:hypothetical protein
MDNTDVWDTTNETAYTKLFKLPFSEAKGNKEKSYFRFPLGKNGHMICPNTYFGLEE